MASREKRAFLIRVNPEIIEAVEKLAALRPAARVSGGGAGPGGVADDMPVRDWITRRNAQTRRR